MTITIWLQSGPALALAKTLLHSLWQSAIAAFLLAACLRFIQSARLRYAAACGALGAIVVASIGTFVFLAPTAAPQHRPQPAVYANLGSGIPYPANVTAVSSRSLLQTTLP